MFKKKIFLSLFVFLTLCLVSTSAFFPQNAFADNSEDDYLCHRCGMKVEKEYPMTVTGVTDDTWHETCLPCALRDILELGNGSGTITAYGETTKKKIEIVIKDEKIVKMTPADAVFLEGGSCYKNLLFYDMKNAEAFVKETPWAKKEMLKTPADILKKLRKQTMHMTHCSLCGATLADKESTFASVVTQNDRRFVLCCAHCAIFTAARLEDELKSVIAKDYASGDFFNAKKGFFLIGSDIKACCTPPTIAFRYREDAEQFKKKNGGEIYNLEGALKIIFPW